MAGYGWGGTVAGVRSRDAGPVEPGIPTGINVAVGCVVLVVAAFVAGAVPAWATVGRLVPVLLGLAGFAAVTIDPLAAVAMVGVAFLIVNGFLVNRLGELSWHGVSDLWSLCAMTAAAGGGLGAGVARRAVRRWWLWRSRVQQIERWANQAALTGDREEEGYA
jgi:hypothetical protein